MGSDETVTVPRVIEYKDDQPLDLNGPVVGVLNSNPANRRCSVLVEEPEELHEGGSETSERVTIEEESYTNISEMEYRDLQQFAKDNEMDIKLNQSTEDLRAAIEDEL